MTEEQKLALAETIFEKALEELERDYQAKWDANSAYLILGQAMMSVINESYNKVQAATELMQGLVQLQYYGKNMTAERRTEIIDAAYRFGVDTTKRGIDLHKITEAIKNNPITQSEWDRFCLSLKMAEE